LADKPEPLAPCDGCRSRVMGGVLLPWRAAILLLTPESPMKSLACFFVASLILLNSASAEVVLVKEGVSQAPIILFADAPPYTQQAAEELADYIEKTSGARPEIIQGEPEQMPETAIWVGIQPKVKEAFPKLDLNFDHPEEVLITANDKHLLIAGRDRWDPDNLEVEGIDEKIIGRQLEYGTVNAVYTFLQDYLGVRWLWPGEWGEDILEQETIAFEPFEYRYHPQIRSRGGVFNFSSLSNKGYGRAHEWTRKQRLQLGSLEMSGGHGFGDWWERFHETKPELFALQPNGKRDGHPNPRTAKLCQSNPAVWDQWLKDVEHQLEEDPNQKVFNGSPNDGWSSGHCVCEDCRAWDASEGEPRLMHWHHYREERPALTDRHVTFANKLAAKLKERYPDEDYYVMMLSYGHSRPAPVNAKPADNVIMASVANFFGRTNLVDRGSTWGTTHRDQFLAWGKVAPNLMWRPNTGSPAGWRQGLPDVHIQQTIKDLKMVTENQCLGIYIDAVWEHWAMQGPQYYIMAQLVWDASQDADAILQDYYQRAFGPAAESMEQFFTYMEKQRMAYVEKDETGGSYFAYPKFLTPDVIQKGDEFLQQAASKAETGNELHQKRVEFTTAGWRFSKLVIENAILMESYWAKAALDPKKSRAANAGEPMLDEKVAKEVRANWEQMEQICLDYPYSVNWGPVRPSTSRMIGLHPDYPNPKWTPQLGPQDLDQN